MNQKDKKIRKAWNSGMRVPAIAQRVGLRTERVKEGLKRLGLTTEERLQEQEIRGWSRISI